VRETDQPVALPCPKCGALVPIVQPVDGKLLTCRSCGESLKLVWEEQEGGCGGHNPGGGGLALSLLTTGGAVFGSVMLGSYITGALPEPEDPEAVKRKKKRNLVASLTAGGLIGLIAALIRG